MNQSKLTNNDKIIVIIMLQFIKCPSVQLRISHSWADFNQTFWISLIYVWKCFKLYQKMQLALDILLLIADAWFTYTCVGIQIPLIKNKTKIKLSARLSWLTAPVLHVSHWFSQYIWSSNLCIPSFYLCPFSQTSAYLFYAPLRPISFLFSCRLN